MLVRNHHTLSTLSSQQQNISRRKKRRQTAQWKRYDQQLTSYLTANIWNRNSVKLAKQNFICVALKRFSLKGQAAVPGIS